jgi:hypothetical protein
MKTGQIRFGFLASAVLIAAPILVVGCAAHTSYGYRVYDPGYSDYHVYDRNEEVYYNRWTVETNRPHATSGNCAMMKSGVLEVEARASGSPLNRVVRRRIDRSEWACERFASQARFFLLSQTICNRVRG